MVGRKQLSHAVAFSHLADWKTWDLSPRFLIGTAVLGTPVYGFSRNRIRRLTMQGVKGLIVMSAVILAVALGACRREAEQTPLKLGADVPASEQVAR